MIMFMFCMKTYCNYHTGYHVHLLFYLQPIISSSASLADSLYDVEFVRHHLESKGLHYQPLCGSHGSHDLFSLEACLAAYTSLDILCGSNQFLCEHCNTPQGHPDKVSNTIVVFIIIMYYTIIEVDYYCKQQWSKLLMVWRFQFGN